MSKLTTSIMERYEFILRFDDDEHRLTPYNGLTVQQVGELLVDLSAALDLKETQSLMLSNIKGNCYALEFTTQSLTVFETLKVIHKNVSNNQYQGFTNNQKKYVSRLKTIVGTRLNLRAYDKDKSFSIKVDQIVLPEDPSYYFEITSVYGIITSIGGTSLDSKAFIKINQGNYKIEISKIHENQLIKYYKKNKLNFQVKNKIDFQTDKILSAILLDFEVLEDKSFMDLVQEARLQFPDGLLLNHSIE